jgi:hypothetical protein
VDVVEHVLVPFGLQQQVGRIRVAQGCHQRAEVVHGALEQAQRNDAVRAAVQEQRRQVQAVRAGGCGIGERQEPLVRVGPDEPHNARILAEPSAGDRRELGMDAADEAPGVAGGEQGQGPERHIPHQSPAHPAPYGWFHQDQPMDRFGSESSARYQRNATAEAFPQQEHAGPIGRPEHLDDGAQVADQTTPPVPAAAAVRVAEPALVEGVDPQPAPGKGRTGFREGEAEIAEGVDADQRGGRLAGGFPGYQWQAKAVRHHHHPLTDGEAGVRNAATAFAPASSDLRHYGILEPHAATGLALTPVLGNVTGGLEETSWRKGKVSVEWLSGRRRSSPVAGIRGETTSLALLPGSNRWHRFASVRGAGEPRENGRILMRPILATMTLSIGLLAAASAIARDDGLPFGPDDVKRELVGKVWQVELPNGASAVETFREDGTVKITGGLSDRGYWRIWEQGYCTQWFRMRNGAERCFTLDKTTDGKIRVWKPDGEISMTILSTAPIE